MIRTIRKPDDMPMIGRMTRIKKGQYEVVIKFAKSRRIYHIERVGARNRAAVQVFFNREHRAIKWSRGRKS